MSQNLHDRTVYVATIGNMNKTVQLLKNTLFQDDVRFGEGRVSLK